MYMSLVQKDDVSARQIPPMKNLHVILDGLTTGSSGDQYPMVNQVNPRHSPTVQEIMPAIFVSESGARVPYKQNVSL